MTHPSTAVHHPADPRSQMLALCQAERNFTAALEPRNLVLFFDGTGNILGNQADTNVVKLWRQIDRSATANQLIYYDPGVGTTSDFPPDSLMGSVSSHWHRLVGLALGGGIFENIADGYRFLVDNYRAGDRIFIFGFSRGAFTARAVAGMVNMYGLIYSNGLSLLPAMVRTYFSNSQAAHSSTQKRQDFADDVRLRLSLGRLPLVHFVGVWDTVESVGGVLGGVKISNPASVHDKRFVHIRHALSLHENRSPYSPRLYVEPNFSQHECTLRSFEQQWFRGVHSDVGGSYMEDGLSNISLDWIKDAAVAVGGLRVAATPALRHEPKQPMHDQVLKCPLWAYAGLSSRSRPQDAQLHASAVPIQGTTPAQSGSGDTTWRIVGWTAFLASIALFVWTYRAGIDACKEPMAALHSLPWAQLTAAWIPSMSCDAQQISGALFADSFFMLSYALVMPYLVAWAVRRIAPRCVAQGVELPWVARNAHWCMLAVIACDVLENWFTPSLASPGQSVARIACSMASTAKFSALGALIFLWVRAALAKR